MIGPINRGDYWTNGKTVMHLWSYNDHANCCVLTWPTADTPSSRRTMAIRDLRKELDLGFRSMTGAEVIAWCDGGPVPQSSSNP